MKYLNPVLRECSRGDSPLIQSDDSGNSVIKLQETMVLFYLASGRCFQKIETELRVERGTEVP